MTAPGPREAQHTDRKPARPAGGHQAAGRWELLRALGAVALDDPACTPRLASALGLPRWSTAEHTRLFVLSLPPYASIYLGAEGKLGGEGSDRVAGLWRTLGLTPPAGADHLAAILALYAEAGEASATARTPATRQHLDHVRGVVLWEHLWPWLPSYLDAVTRTAPHAAAWADLAARALAREARLSRPPASLPAALRLAPAGLSADAGYGDLLDTLTAPVRAGFILTHGDLAVLAEHNGLGVRHGERRFALRALLEQGPEAALSWLSGHARRAARQHRHRADATGGSGHQVDRWWAARASRSAGVLDGLARRARDAAA